MHWLETKIPPPIVMLLFAGPGIWYHYMKVGTLEWIAFISPFYWVFPALAFLIIGAGIWAFQKHRTTVNPHTPSEASSLVTSGIFSYTRNPMYLGMLLCLCAVAVKTVNVFALLCIPMFMIYLTRFQIIPEEQAIEAKFGDQYREYKKRVRRWI